MEDDSIKQYAFIQNNLIPKILKTLNEPTLINSKVTQDSKLDGFMSAIYKIELETVDCAIKA